VYTIIFKALLGRRRSREGPTSSAIAKSASKTSNY